jgi:hypothetical protein
MPEDEFVRAHPLLEAVAEDGEQLDLIISLITSADDESWLLERLSDALRD